MKWTIEIDQVDSAIKVMESSAYFDDEVYELESIEALIKYIQDNIELKKNRAST
jgi:hypothetical protein